jgi:poly-gamma-glutamate synthesis protein (capsule biosynthesis protein)
LPPDFKSLRLIQTPARSGTMGSPLKLLLVGDVMFGRLVNERLRTEPAAYPWGDTLPLFRQADWRGCNLECVISDHGSPWARSPKMFHFRSDAKNLAVLQAAGIDAVSLANNHTLDFNHRGMIEMLRLLDGSHIAHSGAGLNWKEASRPAITEARGTRIGLLSFTDNEPGWEAGDDHSGTFYVAVDTRDERTEKLLSAVRSARREVDLLVIAAHWGGNWGFQPPAAHRALAHDLVRAGADVIFGHSAHVCRGIEIFERRLILYSTGDFVDDYAVDPVERNDRSWAFELHADARRITSLHLYPTVIRDCQARLAGGGEAREMVATMKDLCARLMTALTTPGAPDRPVIAIH